MGAYNPGYTVSKVRVNRLAPATARLFSHEGTKDEPVGTPGKHANNTAHPLALCLGAVLFCSSAFAYQNQTPVKAGGRVRRRHLRTIAPWETLVQSSRQAGPLKDVQPQ